MSAGLGILDFFNSSSAIFLTGATGFVGKLVLEKILRTTECQEIYLLIRKDKRGRTALERLKEDILTKDIFQKSAPLAKHAILQGFLNVEEMMLARCKVLEGDVLKNSAGLSESALQMVLQNVTGIINCAASVDFDAPLEAALKSNTMGPCFILDMAMLCKKLKVFLHVSTAYTNSNSQGEIEEKVFGLRDDHLLQMFNDVKSFSSPASAKFVKDTFPGFPNTYTLTKRIAEILLTRKMKEYFQDPKQHLFEFILFRPTIIGSCFQEPLAGWLDAVLGASALLLIGSMGLMRWCPGRLGCIGDQIPVDFVVNLILASMAALNKGAITGSEDHCTVIHCGTSHLNPISWGNFEHFALDYFSTNPCDRRIGKPWVSFVENQNENKILDFLTNKLPVKIAHTVTQTFASRSNAAKLLTKYQKGLDLSDKVSGFFRPFTTQDWLFRTDKILALLPQMSDEEKRVFPIDPRNFDWEYFAKGMCYGIRKYVLKEHTAIPPKKEKMANLAIAPYHTAIQLTDQGPNFSMKKVRDQMFPMYVFAKRGVPLLYKNSASSWLSLTLAQRKELTMSCLDVRSALQKEIKNLQEEAKTKGRSTDDTKNREKCNEMFDKIYASLEGDLCLRALQLQAPFFGRLYFSIFKTIDFGDIAILEKISEIMKNNPNDSVVYLPTHKSYFDFLLFGYALLCCGMKLPFVAAGEEFAKIPMFSKILKRSGAFFIKRSFSTNKDVAYSAILESYVKNILKHHRALQFYPEGGRTRSGLTLPPKFGFIRWLVKSYMNNEVSDVHLVPISLNYEKVIEAETFPQELIGEKKVSESFGRVISSAKLIIKDCGRVSLRVAEPISLKKFISEQNLDLKDKKNIVSKIGRKLCEIQTSILEIPITSVFAALVLQNRNGVSEDDLVPGILMLRRMIAERDGRMGPLEVMPEESIKKEIEVLCRVVFETALLYDKGLISISGSRGVSDARNRKAILLLAYYRNFSTHLFVDEGLIIASILAHGGVSVESEKLRNHIFSLVKFLQTQYSVFDLSMLNSDEDMKIQSSRWIEILNSKLEFMKSKQLLLMDAGSISLNYSKHTELLLLYSYVEPMIESLYCATTNLTHLLSYSGDEEGTIKASSRQMMIGFLAKHAQWLCESMFQNGEIQNYEATSIFVMKRICNSFVDLGILEIAEDQSTEPLPMTVGSGEIDDESQAIDPSVWEPKEEKKDKIVRLASTYSCFQKIETLASTFKNTTFARRLPPAFTKPKARL
eukprot:GHVP01054050.1.p1 GENE.GHVP01054050.1~~GHVP01054050.1.p1  ORF type:complete len:1243 (+),score=246.08 GHVP01054050.1:77-3805(+)